MSTGSFKMLSTKWIYKSYILIMHKHDLELDNLQGLICHKTQPNQILYI